MSNLLVVAPSFNLVGDGISLTSTIKLTDLLNYITFSHLPDSISSVSPLPSDTVFTVTTDPSDKKIILTFPTPLLTRVQYNFNVRLELNV